MSMRYQAGVLSDSYFPLDVPSAPTVGTLSSPSGGTLSLTFTAPTKTGSAAITSYTVVATNSSTGAIVTGTGTSSPVTVSGATPNDSYTAKVYASNSYGGGPLSDASNTATVLATGQAAYTTPGTYSWIAPSGITSVSAVVVGGGGSGYSSHDSNGGGGGCLAFKNYITVVPGSSYTVYVGAGGAAPTPASATSNNGQQSYFIDASTLQANPGRGGAGSNLGPTPANDGIVGDGGGYGGYGESSRGGGGGAGGYLGRGGMTTYAGNPTPPVSGGGGGSGGISVNDVNGAAGGGVGLLGIGSNGTNPTFDGTTWANGAWSYTLANAQAFLASQGGKGGSGGDNPVVVPQSVSGSYPFRTDGGNYGGGGGGCYNNNGGAAGKGGDGAVRIIWPASGSINRAFPSTNTGDM